MGYPAETAPNPRRIGRTILVCAGVLAGLIGCYQPKVVSGGLKCSIASSDCPDGFTCRSNRCISDGDAAGGRSGAGGRSPGGAGGAGVGGMGGGRGGAGGADTCATPIAALCTAPATSSGCDPVCQTGCGCGLRCNVTASGPACGPPLGAKGVGQVCDVGADDCAPGSACLREACGTNLGRCYRFCRDGSMCSASSACARAATLPDGTSSGQRVCDMGDQDCDPYAATSCPDPALRCYVTGPSRTTCDCPSAPGAEAKEGDACSAYNDCLPGLACLQVGGASRCLRLCHSVSDCPSCTPLGAVNYCAP